MDINMTSIGTRIKQRRNELKLTQTDIDRECGIKSGALSQIEHGTRTPSVITFYSLSKVLNCSMEWLITGTPNSENDFIDHKGNEKFSNIEQCPSEQTKSAFLCSSDLSEKDFLQLYNLLSNDAKSKVMSYLKFLLHEDTV